MDKDSEINLQKFYQRLNFNLQKKQKKVNEKSIFISALDMKSNDRYRLLSESAVSTDEIPKSILTDLKTKKWIRNTDTLNTYTITAKGIWEIENTSSKISDNILLEYIDEKFFNVYGISEKPLSDKHKVVIFSMIAARTFSEKSSVDLNRDETARNTWKDIIDESYEKLKTLHLISKLNRESLYGIQGNEPPVSTVFRHTDDLPKKTRGLFKAPGNRKYFLDLYLDSKISKDGLSHLFKLIFDEKILAIPDINEIDSFCRYIANNKNIYIFDPREHIFSRPEYDEIIRDTLLFE